MSTTRKITAHLRTEDTDRLPKLLKLYAGDTQAVAMIKEEIKRRNHLTK